MGTWGSGNLDSDSAYDLLVERSRELADSIVTLAATKEAAEFDESSHVELFVNIETFFALHRHRLIVCCPDPDVIVELKAKFMPHWEAYTKENSGAWDERRSIIEKTFDRLIQICAREEQRMEDGPKWEPIQPPPLPALAPSLQFSTQSIFEIAEITLPDTWSIGDLDRELPQRSIARCLSGPRADTLRVGDCQFEIERVIFATGSSLGSAELRDEHLPYIVLAKVSVEAERNDIDTHELACEAEDQLRPHFQADGEYAGGVYCLDTINQFDFDGVKAHRPIACTSDEHLQWQQTLYFHREDAAALLMLETGCVGRAFGDDTVDAHLMNYITDSIRRRGDKH